MSITAFIYRICVPGLEDLCYVGSTTKTLADRLKDHKYSAKSASKYKFASSVLFEEGNEPVIELLEEIECDSKQEILEHERIWLDKYPDAINKNDPALTPEERHERAKATLLKCYYAKRDERMKQAREWKLANQEHIRAYAVGRREITREQERARNAAGYKEKRNAAKKEKAVCDVCHKEMNKNSLWTHKKSVHL